MVINFSKLWIAYPTESQADLFNVLGGGWPSLIGDPSYDNTCALRMCVAMSKVGQTPPSILVSSDGNLKDGSGNGLIIRVPTIKMWLEQLIGSSSWGTSKAQGASIESQIPAWQGILLYLVPGDRTASGHIDLWDTNRCRNDCHSNYAMAATSVELWRL